MAYDKLRRLAGRGENKRPGIIYDEEGDIYDALKWGGYLMASHTPEPGIYHQWTACRDLYDVYQRYMRTVRFGTKEHLSRVEFGVALRAVYEIPIERKLLVMKDENGKSVRRTAYRGFKGPKSFHRRPKQGRPRVDR